MGQRSTHKRVSILAVRMFIRARNLESPRRARAATFAVRRCDQWVQSDQSHQTMSTFQRAADIDMNMIAVLTCETPRTFSALIVVYHVTRIPPHSMLPLYHYSRKKNNECCVEITCSPACMWFTRPAADSAAASTHYCHYIAIAAHDCACTSARHFVSARGSAAAYKAHTDDKQHDFTAPVHHHHGAHDFRRVSKVWTARSAVCRQTTKSRPEQEHGEHTHTQLWANTIFA